MVILEQGGVCSNLAQSCNIYFNHEGAKKTKENNRQMRLTLCALCASMVDSNRNNHQLLDWAGVCLGRFAPNNHITMKFRLSLLPTLLRRLRFLYHMSAQ